MNQHVGELAFSEEEMENFQVGVTHIPPLRWCMKIDNDGGIAENVAFGKSVLKAGAMP